MARFLAIDWDQNQLHLAEANISGTSVKIQRAVVTQEEQSPFTAADPEALGKLLRERLKTAGIAGAPVLACVGRDRVIQKDLRFPSVTAHEEPAIVRFQAMKELSESPDDVVIDFTTAGDTEAKGETRALTMILRREVLEAYQKVCAGAGLQLAALAPRPIGLAACLRRVVGTTALTPAPEPADGAVVIVTVAEKWAEFCVMRGKALLFARSLAAGPNLPTDVRRNLAVYAGQNAQNPVRAIYLAGNGIAAVRERLTESVDVPIYSFDPFAGAERPELPINHRGSFAGAIGLCYARAEKGGLPINFAQPRQPRAPENPQKRKMLAAAALLILLAGGGFLFAQQQLTRADQDARAAEKLRDDMAKDAAERKEELDRFKAMENWDGVVWLDELYNLADNIPDVNQLRITQITVAPLTAKTKQRYAATVTLKGYVTSRNSDHKALDDFVSNLWKDGHYKVVKTAWTGSSFTITINVEKRPPEKYETRIKAPV